MPMGTGTIYCLGFHSKERGGIELTGAVFFSREDALGVEIDDDDFPGSVPFLVLWGPGEQDFTPTHLWMRSAGKWFEVPGVIEG